MARCITKFGSSGTPGKHGLGRILVNAKEERLLDEVPSVQFNASIPIQCIYQNK